MGLHTVSVRSNSRRRVLSRGIACGISLALAAGCSASGSGGEETSVVPEQPAPNPDNQTPATPGTPQTPTAGGSGGFDLGDDVGDQVTPMGCQQAARTFVPKIPTVFLLVDRSGTMFEPIGGDANVTAWGALRSGALQVMQELEQSVRFGFGAFSGQTLAGNACMLDVPTVAPALNNYAAVAALYEPLAKPTNPQNKETPTVLALEAAAAQLRSDPAEGDKYILFVTDGEPDYCGDGNNLCPPDSVVGLLQKLASGIAPDGTAVAPIQTLVFGISSEAADILPTVLQGFANAGVGQPVAPMPREGQNYDPNSLWDQCNGVPGWAADFATTGKPLTRGQTIGTYTTDLTSGGTAPVYRPDPTDQAALTSQIRAALAGVKSCTFDLGSDGVQVDLARQDLGDVAKVIVNGAAVPFDTTNGWHMLSETTVQLEGAACEGWRAPTEETSINFDFPCDIFILR
jgi:hypothetical protein